MLWRFTIIDGSTETVVDEPGDWASLNKIINRDKDWHGIFFGFTENVLDFSGEAFFILQTEFELNGIDGSLLLKIEWKCEECPDYELFYLGKFDFQQYNEICGDDCSIKIGLENTDASTLIKNRMDISVDLTSDKAYDGTTSLTNYTGLGQEIQIPGKAILIKSRAENDGTITSANLVDDPEWHDNDGGPQMRGQVIPAFNKTLLTDIGDTTFYDTIQLVNGGFLNRPVGIYPIVDVQTFSTLKCLTSAAVINYRYKGMVTSNIAITDTLKIYRLPAGADETNAANYETIASHPIGASGVTFDFTDSVPVTLNVGDRIYMYIFLNVINYTLYTDYILQEDPECFFEVKMTSLCDPSPATTYLLHESMSRVVEHITNNTYKFKSEYYGRTDSQPYAYAADGCGGLRTLTNGLQIRRAKLQDSSAPKVFLSLKEGMESLNAIDCIGMGIEGSDLRVEPVKYFYANDIIFIADGVREITRNVRNDRIWNQFNFGYDKYETESTNGLDAIHTKRQYRLQIENSDKKLEKFSKIIGDGYAIEVTRRKFGTSEDWRYDQNIFLLCLKRLSGLVVDQGNITSAANLFDPPTVLNYAVSPVRNAMRWFKWLVQGIRDYAATSILFSSGEGNYVAEGLLTTGCIIEAGTMAENDPITIANFDDPTEPVPFVKAEKIVFTFPVGLNEFIFMAANKYGKVQYRKNPEDDWKYGWIDSLKYNPNDGDADFTLIPVQ